MNGFANKWCQESFQGGWHRSATMRSVLRDQPHQGTPFVLSITLIYHHISGNLKKWNISYSLPFSFTLKSIRCPGELKILRWWWQNFLTANNFNKMSCVKGCSCYKWVGKHMFQKCFSHSFPPFLSSFLFSKSRFLDILSSLHVNLRGWMWWEAVE